ncbi:MAG: hypothetical protein KatS3mg002_0996 [Candidatus Woesearchaeota archaeon]|nr:MAG: hypothetical protein KatS3mg002_0996 [Candidatus Woesearchaeota archaeon]
MYRILNLRMGLSLIIISKFYIDRSTDKLYAYYKYDTSEKYLIHDSNSLEKAVKKIIKRIKLTEGKF